MQQLRVWLWLCALVACCSAADMSKPHGHRGILQPYRVDHPLPTITLDMQQRLNQGHPVTQRTRDGSQGRGLVIQDIHAPPDIVAKVIRDYTNYPKMVPHVSRVETYGTTKGRNGIETTHCKFTVSVLGFKISYFLVLTYHPSTRVTTWTLDYDRLSDLDDSVGYWRVLDHAGPNNDRKSAAQWSRVVYSTQLKVKGWVPEPIMNYLSEKALVEATAWVKRESERLYAASAAGAAASSPAAVVPSTVSSTVAPSRRSPAAVTLVVSNLVLLLSSTYFAMQVAASPEKKLLVALASILGSLEVFLIHKAVTS